MDRRRVRSVVLAVLATVAVALTATAAAPLFSQEQGTDDPAGATATGPDRTNQETSDIQLPSDFIVVAVLIVGALGFAVQFARDPWKILKLSAMLSAFAVVFVGVLSFIYRNVAIDYFTANGSQDIAPTNVSLTATPPPTESGYGDGSSDPLILPVEDALFILLVVGVVGLGTFLVWRSKTVQSLLGEESNTEDVGPDDGLEGVSRVAGEAADNVDAASTPEVADNAIYGAWRDMIRFLGVRDPQAETPRQFARAAREAGLDPDDVSVLTRAFEEVRYGDAALSEDRRNRVIESLRRIETAHSDDDPNPSQADQTEDGPDRAESREGPR